MIVTLKPGVRIVGFAVDTWQVQRHGPDRPTHTLAEASSFTEAFKKALAQGVVQPGKPLDLSGFNALIADAGRRFTLAQATRIRLCEGYTAEQSGGRWILTRDTGRGGKHSVQAGESSTVAGILATAVWHQSFRAKRAMTIDQVGPYLTGIAQRLLEGAAAETDGRGELIAGRASR